MNISDAQLAAFVDGELPAEDRAAVAAAIAADPELARSLAAQRALRERLRQAFDPTLNEPVPQRLLDAVQGSPIVDFDVAKPRRRRTLLAATAWMAVAASLVLAVLVFPRLLQRVGREPDIVVAGSNRIAGGELARALSLRLASEPASGRVQLGLSFLAKSGEYCRTFAVAQNGGTAAGLACREQESWRIHVLEPVSRPAGELGGYRQAASVLSPLLLQAVETRIAGEPLDAAGEASARGSGWRRTSQAPK